MKNLALLAALVLSACLAEREEGMGPDAASDPHTLMECVGWQQGRDCEAACATPPDPTVHVCPVDWNGLRGACVVDQGQDLVRFVECK